jgi:hypothetical protein
MEVELPQGTNALLVSHKFNENNPKIRQDYSSELRALRFLEQCRNQYFKSFFVITATHSEDIKRNLYFDNSRR